MKQSSKKRLFYGFAIALLLVSNSLTALAVYFSMRAEPPPVELTSEMLFASVSPSVCTIESQGETGTGFLVGTKLDAKGRTLYIATNVHVVELFISSPLGIDITIDFPQNEGDVYRDTEVRIAGYDAVLDVAVLAVRDKRTELKRKSVIQEVNDSPANATQLMLIGNLSGKGVKAFTHASAAVFGMDEVIYSAANDRYELMMGVSVDVNGGCSGGPILDRSGRFVGIGKAQLFEAGRPVAGVSYAIPAAICYPVIQKAMLVDDGKSVHRIEGAVLNTNTLNLSELNLMLTQSGSAITVLSDSVPYATDGEGFKAGDVVESFGAKRAPLTFTDILGETLRYANESKDVPQALKDIYTGECLTVCVRRNDETKTIRYTNKKEIGL